MPVSLIERRKSGNRADRAGRGDRQARAYHLASVRDVLDSAKHRERVLSGALKLGAIPSIAPYLLSAALPELQRRSPDLTLHLRETITETLVRELVSGDLDLILVALPIEGHEIETRSLSATSSSLRRAPARASAPRRPTCLRMSGCCCSRRAIACDQALSFCRRVTPEARESFGASILATIVQRVPIATASYSCRKFGGVTFACCISLRRSQNARSGSPGERPRRARRTFRLCEVAQGRDAAPRQA